MSSRRKLRRVLIAGQIILLVGCATQDVSRSDDTRIYCVKTGLKSGRICTPEPIPSAGVEAEAKRFEPIAGAYTLYVVRSAWADRAMRLKIILDETKHVWTLPRTLVRMRMSPGAHNLSFEWEGKVQNLQIEARSGEVKFVEIAGASTLWGKSYHWTDADPAGARERASKTRLISDLY